MFLSHLLRSANRIAKPRRSMNQRLRLETLEDRSVPTMIFWTGGFHTNIWADPRNWNPNRVPGLGDDVVIGSGFTNPVLLGTAQIGGLTVSANGHLTVGNGAILSVGAFGGS